MDYRNQKETKKRTHFKPIFSAIARKSIIKTLVYTQSIAYKDGFGNIKIGYNRINNLDIFLIRPLPYGTQKFGKSNKA